MDQFLKRTDTLDCDNESIKAKAQELVKGLETDKEKAVALFYFVRDEIKHNAYSPGNLIEHFRASAILERGHGFCQQKAILLATIARAAGVPARIGFADIRDHQLSQKFRDMIGGSNILLYHGYTEIFINGKWVHASPAYDIDICNKSGFIPVEFDGENDHRDSQYVKNGELHIEWVKDHGYFEDFTYDDICKIREEFMAVLNKEQIENMAKWGGS